MEQVRLGILKVQTQPSPPAESAPLVVKTAKPLLLSAPQKKIGPNDPCSCGSKIKFKKCHGRGKGRV